MSDKSIIATGCEGCTHRTQKNVREGSGHHYHRCWGCIRHPEASDKWRAV